MSKRREVGRLRQAAQAGDMEAATELADMLEHEGDLSGAERWNRYAAEAGDLDGTVGLGILLCKKQNFEEAELWLRKAVADPKHTEAPGFCEAVLGKCLLSLGKLDEAEQWLAIGAAANIDFAVEDLERLTKARADGTLSNPRQGPGSDVLQTFDVDSIIFYDGSGHRLGSSICTLTRSRLSSMTPEGNQPDSVARHYWCEYTRPDHLAETAAYYRPRRCVRHLLPEQGPKV